MTTHFPLNDFLMHYRQRATHALEVKTLFPLLQVAILSSLITLLFVPTPWVSGLYCGLLILWQVALSGRLALQSWHPHMRICSQEAALSVVAAAWYGALGLALDVPAAASVMALTLVTMGLYGWFCHDHS